MPKFGKTVPLRSEHFIEFEKCFGGDPFGQTPRKDEGETGRFRCFTREEIARPNENLDIGWLREDEVDGEEEVTDLEDIVAAIVGHLRAALAEIESVVHEIDEAEGVKG